ncbi:hypothetical protein HYQ46_009957 [Verticillium longisporum]|nr:hypothetical protein HYQ46_009957 [Verticillium longisporum]
MPKNPKDSIGDDEIYEVLKGVFAKAENLCVSLMRPGQTPEERRREFVESFFWCFTGGAKTDFTKDDLADLHDKIMAGHVPEEDRKFWNKYSLKLVRFLADARLFVTRGAVIGYAERVCDARPGDLLISFKGCTAESVLINRAVGDKLELINGCFLHFSPEESKAHQKTVDDVNDGTFKTEKYTLL